MVQKKYQAYKTREDWKEQYDMPHFEFEEPMIEKLEEVESKAFKFLTGYNL